MSEYEPEHRAGDAPKDFEEEPIVGDAPPEARTLFSNKVYDGLKWVSFVLLPALGAAYFALSQLLGLPFGVEVVGVLAILDTLLGTLLRKSTQQYENSDAKYDGAVVIAANAETGNSDLNVSLNPQALASKREITVRVNRV